MPHTNFLLTDVLVLLFQLGMAGVFIFRVDIDLSPPHRLAIMIFHWFVLIWCWWLGVRWISRAQVVKALRRAILLSLPVPLGIGAILWTGLLAYFGCALYVRFVSTRMPKDMQYWYENSPSVALIAAGAWLLFVAMFCRCLARWAVQEPPVDRAGQEDDMPKNCKGHRFGLVVAFLLLASLVSAAISLWLATDIPTEPRTVLLWSRSKRNYEQATFSFEFGIRDDPFGIALNDWDLLFGNSPQQDTFDVNTMTDDRSVIQDLGRKLWSEIGKLPWLPAPPEPMSGVGPSLPAIPGHMYLVHTKDTNSDLYALFRVETLTPGTSCVISWRRVKEDELLEEDASSAQPAVPQK